jgi:hypothetical protein
MKLACPVGLYQLDGVLESRRPVKAMLKGFTNQPVGRYMVYAVAFIDLYEQLAALLPCYAVGHHWCHTGRGPLLLACIS